MEGCVAWERDDGAYTDAQVVQHVLHHVLPDLRRDKYTAVTIYINMYDFRNIYRSINW